MVIEWALFSVELYSTPKEREQGKFKQKSETQHDGLLAERGPLYQDLREGPRYLCVISRTDTRPSSPRRGL